MKHVTFTDKSLLIDDVTADLLIEYAALLVTHGVADSVEVHAFSSDGDEVEAKFLLSAGAPLMAESSHTSMNEPSNDEAIAYMRERMAALSARPNALPTDDEDASDSAMLDSLDL